MLLSTFPEIAEFNICPISISLKKSPAYCFEFCINDCIPNVFSCSCIIVPSSVVLAAIELTGMHIRHTQIKKIKIYPPLSHGDGSLGSFLSHKNRPYGTIYNYFAS